MKRKILVLLCLVLSSSVMLVSIWGYKLIPYVKKTFPTDNIDAVVFTMTQNVMGARTFLFDFLRDSFVSAWTSLAYMYVLCVFLSFTLTIALKIVSKKIKLKRIFLFVFVLASGVWLIVFLYSALTELPIKAYKDYVGSVDSPIHSEFYQKEFVYPDSVMITAPSNKKNLMLIMLESMETGFQNFERGGSLPVNRIPEISQYMDDNLSFQPGGVQLAGLGWTMADVVGKTCGLPLFFPGGISGNQLGVREFLPNAKCLTDLLKENGYNVVFSQGSSLSFASMKYFLKSHGNPTAYDLAYYQKKGFLKNDTIHFWGVRDKLLYEFAKDHVSQMDEIGKPWFMWLQTIDTHTPFGYLDKSCKESVEIEEENQYPYVLHCASKMLDEFLKWSKTQSWYDNTVFVVVGDHNSHVNYRTIGYERENVPRFWLNFMINSEKETQKTKRSFSSFDLYPTILESMGFDIEGRALGLGRSLFSDEPTMLEKYKRDSLNKMLKMKNFEYDYFLYSK